MWFTLFGGNACVCWFFPTELRCYYFPFRVVGRVFGLVQALGRLNPFPV